MTAWLQLTDKQRRTSIAQAAIISGITAKAIEKDWWVYFATDKKVNEFFCPGRGAMGIIVASHSCTTYHWGSLIAF